MTTEAVTFKHRRTEAGYEVIMPNGVPWLVVALKCPRPWIQSPSNVTLDALNAWASDYGLPGYFEQQTPGDPMSYGFTRFSGQFYGAENCRGNLDTFYDLIGWQPPVDKLMAPPPFTEEVLKILEFAENPSLGPVIELALTEAWVGGFKAGQKQ